MSGIIVLILRILLAAALYGFIFWAVFTIWKDLQTRSQILASKKIPTLIIYPLDFLNTEPYQFETPEVILGRDPTCTFVVPDETVSARHSRFSYRQNQWWLEDLQSTNSTFLNDERVYTPVVIISGDEVRCGKEALLIEILPGA